MFGSKLDICISNACNIKENKWNLEPYFEIEIVPRGFSIQDIKDQTLSQVNVKRTKVQAKLIYNETFVFEIWTGEE